MLFNEHIKDTDCLSRPLYDFLAGRVYILTAYLTLLVKNELAAGTRTAGPERVVKVFDDDDERLLTFGNDERSLNEILLVVDSMTGQDAVNVAKSFNEQLDITGVILTKLDGDTRGGAALSSAYKPP